MNSYLNDELQNIKLNKQLFQKMLFITNALEQGWTVKIQRFIYFYKNMKIKRNIPRELFRKFRCKNFSTDFVLHNNELNNLFNYIYSNNLEIVSYHTNILSFILSNSDLFIKNKICPYVYNTHLRLKYL